MDGQWQDEREYGERRSEDDPADEDEHRVAQSAKEMRQRLARYFGGRAMASARSNVKRISGIIAPLAAAATGFAGRSETSHTENVCACPSADISFAASTAPGGSSRAP